MGAPPPASPTRERPLEDRLDSWKEIAAYLKRDVTTVQRWEKREGMPVHRHLHDRVGSVYASRTELDAWVRSRNLPPTQEEAKQESPTQENENGYLPPDPPAQPPMPARRPFLTRWTWVLSLATVAAGLVVGGTL